MRTALVTGASRGIGRATALRLARDGFRVGVHYGTNEAAAKEVVRLIEAEGGSAFALGADLGVPEQVETLAAEVREAAGRLDVLVNNAAIDHTGPLLAVPAAEIRTTLETNTVAAVLLLQAAARAMVDAGRGGAIINVTSRLASAGVPTMGIYSASKGALLSLTRTAAIELAEHNVRVNAVAPGLTRTPLYEEWMAGLPDPEEVARAQAEAIPLGRIAEPADVAAAVSFLASPGAAYITGVSLPVDGGYLAK